MDYYYEKLGGQKSAYDNALACLTRHDRSFRVQGAFSDDLMALLLSNHPELFYVSQQWRIRKSLMKEEIIPLYLYTEAEERSLRERLEYAVRRFLAEQIREWQSEFDKVRIIHDYLKSHVQYDDASASRTDVDRREVAEAHSVVGALLQGRAVCDGYAKAMKLLCDKVGVECQVVNGVGNSAVSRGPHSWNIVRINGYYHHVDATWDRQLSNNSDMPNYSYLNLSDERIASDHTWDRKWTPPCPDDPYNYFRVTDSLMDSRRQLERFLKEGFQSEEPALMFQVARGSPLAREMPACLESCVWAANSGHTRVNSFRYTIVSDRLIYYLTFQYDAR